MKYKNNIFTIEKSILIIFIILITIANVNAIPPVTTITSTNTNIQIITNPIESIKVNNTFYVRFWAFNSSTGVVLTNSSIYCTVNLMQPDGRNILKVQLTPNNFGLSDSNACQNCFWYNISANNFSQKGIYGLNLRCQTYDNKSLGGDSMVPLEATQSGYVFTTAQAVLYAVSLMLAFSLFCLSLYFSIMIPFRNTVNDDGRIVSINKLKYIKIFLIPMSYVLLLMIVGIIRNITSNFLYLDNITKIFEWIYWIMMSILYPAIVLTFILIIVFLFEDNILKKKIKRGSYR